MQRQTEFRRARYLARSIGEICDAQRVEPQELVPGLLALWWLAWEAHSDYEYEAYYTPDRLGYTPPFSLLQPQVMGTWCHEPGRGGHRESYVIGTPQDVLASLEWGYRTFGGKFIGFKPIVPEVPASRHRIVTWAFSYKGAGGAYVARMRLKALLPRPAHPWIQGPQRQRPAEVPSVSLQDRPPPAALRAAGVRELQETCERANLGG